MLELLIAQGFHNIVEHLLKKRSRLLYSSSKNYFVTLFLNYF